MWHYLNVFRWIWLACLLTRSNIFVCGSFFARDLIWILLYCLGVRDSLFCIMHVALCGRLFSYSFWNNNWAHKETHTTHICDQLNDANMSKHYERHLAQIKMDNGIWWLDATFCYHIISTWFWAVSVVYVIHMMLLIHQEKVVQFFCWKSLKHNEHGFLHATSSNLD